MFMENKMNNENHGNYGEFEAIDQSSTCFSRSEWHTPRIAETDPAWKLDIATKWQGHTQNSFYPKSHPPYRHQPRSVVRKWCKSPTSTIFSGTDSSQAFPLQSPAAQFPTGPLSSSERPRSEAEFQATVAPRFPAQERQT